MMHTFHALIFMVGLVGVGIAAPPSPATDDSTHGDYPHSVPSDVSIITGLQVPGDIEICRDPYHFGVCENVNAQNRSVTLGSKVSHGGRAIFQVAGTVCKYLKADCSEADPIFTIDSTKEAQYLGLNEQVGKAVGIVLCINDWTTAPQPAVPKTAIKPRATRNKRQPYSGLIRVSDQPESCGNALTINMAVDDDNCAAIKQPVYWHVESVFQWKGVICTSIYLSIDIDKYGGYRVTSVHTVTRSRTQQVFVL